MPLECSIYESLVNLYKELAGQQENSNQYEKAIEYLEKQLENLTNLNSMISRVKNEESVENKKKKEENLENRIEVYLKIANLNFKLKFYSSTLECLSVLNNLIKESQDSNNVIIFLKLVVQAERTVLVRRNLRGARPVQQSD